MSTKLENGVLASTGDEWQKRLVQVYDFIDVENLLHRGPTRGVQEVGGLILHGGAEENSPDFNYGP